MLNLFIGSLIAVVLLSGLTYAVGKKRNRTGHIFLALLTVLVLLVTVYQAESLNRYYSFSQVARWTHVPFVVLTTLLLVAVIVRGVRLARRTGNRTSHRHIVHGWLLSLMPTIGTGIWLISTAVPR